MKTANDTANRSTTTNKLGLLVRLECLPGKESAVEQFLQQGHALVQNEPATLTWFALRLGPSTFGIFDTFHDKAGREAHLTGKIAEALFAKAPELFAKPPVIEEVNILASKVTN